MLIAEAFAEQMTLLTADRVFQKYKVPGIECQVGHPAKVRGSGAGGSCADEEVCSTK